ncbi:MAG: hypothetical protein PHD66_02200 [Eubacteriales bacterium]|nr:hypothetical protein [Eubacteriales bacterium]
MHNAIIKLLADFLETTGEYRLDDMPVCNIIFVKDIFEAVAQIDKEYAEAFLSSEDQLYGLFYSTFNDEVTIYILGDENVNYYEHIPHEITHLYDFDNMRQLTGKQYRELQDDKAFVKWSEFHANYLVCKYLLVKDIIYKPDRLCDKIISDMQAFFNAPVIERYKAADYVSRQYGKYVALCEMCPDDYSKHPQRFYLNQSFLDLYDFLWDNRGFKDVIKNLCELKTKYMNL